MPDLNFGLYRIMHAKSAETTQFLEKDLLPQVQAAIALYKTADKAEIGKDLAKVIAGTRAAGMDPTQSPKIKPTLFESSVLTSAALKTP